MRISDNYRHQLNQRAMQDTLGRAEEARRQISTGKRLAQPSDSPIDMAFATQLRSERDDNERHLRSLSDARSWLGIQDSALQSSSTLLARAEELSVQAQNPAMAAGGREAIALEIDGLREQLAMLANTTYQGQAVFGAFNSQAVELTAGGATFVGTAGATVERRVSSSETIAVNTDGAVVFGFDTGDDVFTVLGRLATDIRANDTAAIAADAATLAERATGVREALGQVGTRGALVEAAASRHEDDKVTYSTRISDLEDVNIAEAAVDLAKASKAYEAVLAMTARSQSLSLLDFLR
jgi:flagellar hook-associated protein 3 FlgL